MLAAIEVGFEGDTFVGDLVGVAERHDLVAAAVGQDSALPRHKVVEAVQLLDQI